MRLPADVVRVLSVKSESECSLTLCTLVFVSLWPVSTSFTGGASIGAASDKSDWIDFNNGHP